MKLPKLTHVTRSDGIEAGSLRGQFAEVVIADGAKEVRLSCDPNSDELQMTGGARTTRRGVVTILSGRFRVEWLWSMTNQQGYSDGFRLELRSRKESRVFDFISAASSIEVFEAKRVPNQPTGPTAKAAAHQ